MAENSLVLKLKRPFSFEGKEYTEVDLSALETWTGEDVADVQEKYFKMHPEVNPLDVAMVESNLKYCYFVAHKASELPLEFFQRMPGTNVGALKTLVIGFFHESA
jgi:hypothetical protein